MLINQSKFLTSRFRIVNPLIVRFKSYRVVVAGGGSGGISVASKLKHLAKGDLAIIEPNQTHYYQPLWTLVGGGIKKLSDSACPTASLIPSNAEWLQQRIISFQPQSNNVTLADGTNITYDYLVVALGIQLDFGRIKGLPEALQTPGVCSNYSSSTVEKTWSELQKFRGGNAIFTFPDTPIKCAGAPQKIMYLADDHFRKTNVRNATNIYFNTSLAGLFAVPKYAKALNEIAARKQINLNFRHNLIEIDSANRSAIFEHLDRHDHISFNYDFLHVTPPQKPSPILAPLANEAGFVDVDKYTLQHVRYPNVFSLGDCSSLPTSKTAAAVAAEGNVLYQNLISQINHKPLTFKYDGYTSCPLLTGQQKCILAEFDYDLQPKETLPFDQSKERRLAFWLKKDVIPFIYWNFMVKGKWNGPAWVRRLLHLKLIE